MVILTVDMDGVSTSLPSYTRTPLVRTPSPNLGPYVLLGPRHGRRSCESGPGHTSSRLSQQTVVVDCI